MHRFLVQLMFGITCLFTPLAARADIFSLFDTSTQTITGPHEMVLMANPDGLFYVRADVNGAKVKFVIDTGSDDVVLTRADAERAGIDTAKLKYSEDYDDASGSGMEAETKIHRLTVGPANFTDMPVSIAQDSGGASLLGMAFLRRAKSLEIERDRLVLHW